MAMNEIEINNEIIGGMAVFKGTRVPVKNLFDCLAAGDSAEQFLQDFPTVTRKQVKKVLFSAEKAIEKAVK